MKTYQYHVSGTHCPSCKMFLEDTLQELEPINHVQVDLNQETIQIDADDSTSAEQLLLLMNAVVQANGYAVSLEKPDPQPTDRSLIWKALPIGITVLGLFFLLQKSGLLSVGFGEQPTPASSILIGIIASTSSCLAVVGGLVLSLSARLSKDRRQTRRTFALFHTGRLVSFAVLGGLLGALGSVIGINFTISAILGILASLIMLLLGLNLVGLFERTPFTLPAGVFQSFRSVEDSTLAPFIIGFATFFLPCGFTQSMQVAALSSGSFVSGLFIMLMFALGTLPMLLLLSFGVSSVAHGKHAALFTLSAGIIVLGLGLFSLLAGLAGLGIINPLFSF